MSDSIPLTRPYIPPATLDRVAAVLASGHLTEGSVTRCLEDAFTAFTGARHAIATTSCTTGLELVLRAMGIGAGDEVIVPDYTYPATAQAVMLAGATAVVVDCDPRTLNVDYDAMEAAVTPRTKAFMPVSQFGNPLDWSRLDALAQRKGITVVEDAACGLGSAYQGRRTGGMGRVAVFSLHPRKSVTTGEGGMITTSDDALAGWLRSLKRFGLAGTEGEREALRFVNLGTNSKLSDITAAVGLAQMEMLDALLARRRALAARYALLLRGPEAQGRLRWPLCPPESEHGWQSCCVLVPDRDALLRTMRGEGIEVQIGAYALHREPLFQTHPLCRLEGPLTGSRECYERALALPLFHEMSDAEQERVAGRLTSLLTQCAARV